MLALLAPKNWMSLIISISLEQKLIAVTSANIRAVIRKQLADCQQTYTRGILKKIVAWKCCRCFRFHASWMKMVKILRINALCLIQFFLIKGKNCSSSDIGILMKSLPFLLFYWYIFMKSQEIFNIMFAKSLKVTELQMKIFLCRIPSY